MQYNFMDPGGGGAEFTTAARPPAPPPAGAGAGIVRRAVKTKATKKKQLSEKWLLMAGARPIPTPSHRLSVEYQVTDG